MPPNSVISILTRGYLPRELGKEYHFPSLDLEPGTLQINKVRVKITFVCLPCGKFRSGRYFNSVEATLLSTGTERAAPA